MTSSGRSSGELCVDMLMKVDLVAFLPVSFILFEATTSGQMVLVRLMDPR